MQLSKVVFVKDFVTVKFGKDVAGLIHFFVWKINMNVVNVDYKRHSDCTNFEKTNYFYFKDLSMCNRRLGCDESTYKNIFSFTKQTFGMPVAILPKNYFTIKC